LNVTVRSLALGAALVGVLLAAGACASTAAVRPGSPYGPPYSSTDQRPCQCDENGPRGVGQFQDEPGWHEIVIDGTLVEYYLPQPAPGRPAAPPELLALIHGAGFCHFDGAVEGIHDWRDWADAHNFLLVAPAFERRYGPLYIEDNYPYGRRGSAVAKRYADSPCACAMEGQCEQFARYREHHWFPWGYRAPRDYLWNYIFLVTPHGQRTDRELNRVIRQFRAHYNLGEERFSIFGYSGGGQYIARYMMLHPNNLKRVALGGSGSFLFPTADRKYPFGMAGDVGEERFTAAEWDAKLAAMLGLPVLIFAGGADFVGAGEHPESAWQGTGQLAIAQNFVQALERADGRLRAAGKRPLDASFNCRLIPFPASDHGGAYHDAVVWLQEHWLPAKTPPAEAPAGNLLERTPEPANAGGNPGK